MSRSSLYKPLVEADNEIRVLQFCKSQARHQKDDFLRLTLENVSMNAVKESVDQITKFSSSGTKRSHQDAFGMNEDLGISFGKRNRAEAQPGASNDKQHARFTWGDYMALSYEWGDEMSKQTEILLNETVVEVSETLGLALYRLRDMNQCGRRMRYWIDKLCINQQDVKERNNQVKKMKKIYTEAQSVLVWLGPASREDIQTARVIKSINRDSRSRESGESSRHPQKVSARKQGMLSAFLSKSYFSRLWIIQELALNHNSTLFLCGDLCFTRDTLKLAASLCQYVRRHDKDQLVDSQTSWTVGARAYHLLNLRISESPDSVLNQNMVLGLARLAECMNPRDKVYGILGLLKEDISSRVVPNYGKKAWKVYRDLWKAMLVSSGNLEPIVYTSNLPECDRPSWVPDLTLPFVRSHMTRLLDRNACGGRAAQFRFAKDSARKSILFCKGLKIDTMDGIAATGRRGSTFTQPSSKSETQISPLGVAIGRTLIMAGENLGEHSMIFDIPWSSEPILGYAHRKWDSILSTASYREFDRFRVANADFRIGGVPLRDMWTTSFQHPYPKGVHKHLSWAAISLRGRRLATTAKGFVGLLPEDVQRGDVVAILYGLNFPILLRPYGKYWRVIGEAYLDGFMDGEGTELEEDGGENVVEFGLV